MLRLYNTLTKMVEIFEPLQPGVVRIYTCGPTVYDHPHIGNFRAFIFADLLRRYLKYRGFKVIHVMNLTDVDDKTIKRSNQEGISLGELTERYIDSFFEEISMLNIERFEHYPRATEHIEQMLDLIERLSEKGYTYQKDGSTYFSIERFDKYGRLSKINKSKLVLGARYEVDEYSKENPRDFVLWKAAKKGEPYWDSKFGKGRPGWHLECSAMSMYYLGQTFDIHTGGKDLIFPHHENEIAQSEAATGKPFVRYWLHNEFLSIDTEKMSKSLGNIFTLRELLEQGIEPRTLRYFFISSHYRKPLNYSTQTLRHCSEALKRLDDFVLRLKDYKKGGDTTRSDIMRIIDETRNGFIEQMDDDLNVSGGLGCLFEFVRTVNDLIDHDALSLDDTDAILGFLQEIDSVLAVMRFDEEVLDEDIEAMIKQREQARKNRDFAAADRIRDKLKEMGILLEDTKDGTRWKRKVVD